MKLSSTEINRRYNIRKANAKALFRNMSDEIFSISDICAFLYSSTSYNKNNVEVILDELLKEKYIITFQKGIYVYYTRFKQ